MDRLQGVLESVVSDVLFTNTDAQFSEVALQLLDGTPQLSAEPPKAHRYHAQEANQDLFEIHVSTGRARLQYAERLAIPPRQVLAPESRLVVFALTLVLPKNV